MRALRGAALATLGAAVALCGCSREETPPNVVLIVLDTLRADRLGCYGYPLATTPNLDRLAAQATRYAAAYTTAPWTLPSHASLFTGLYPLEHGAERALDRDGLPRELPLTDSAFTIAEALREAGYETAGFVANNGYLDPHFNLQQGFDLWNVARRYSGRLNQDVFAWLERPRGRPFFLFLNYMDMHRPYNSRPRPGFLPRPVGQDSQQIIEELYPAVLTGQGADPARLQQLVDQYDTAVANLDEQLGRLFARLDELGLRGRTLLVVTSDHGEYLGEHDLLAHSKDVYEEALRVPLIVQEPGQRAGKVETERISLCAVPQLVLAALPPGLRRRLAPRFPPADRPVLAEIRYANERDLVGQPWGDRFRRVRRVLYEGDYKYIASSDGQNELYDLRSDPREARNLVAEMPDAARRMDQRLLALVDTLVRAAEQGAAAASADLRARLEELGY